MKSDSREFDYQPFYCEENIYRLAARLFADPALTQERGSSPKVAFISNPDGHVALFGQRAGRRSDGLVLWDYHVILQAGPLVFDLDTRLPVPVARKTWLEISAPAPVYEAYPELSPLFALVDARRFLESFSTDRRHMKNTEGAYRKPPPSWEPPFRPGEGHNLTAFCSGDHASVEQCCSLSELAAQW